MRKYGIIFAVMALLLSTLALADMMGWGGNGMMGGWFWPFGGAWGVAGIAMAVIWLLAFIFWIWMLVDAVTRRFEDNVEKIIWVLVIIFANIIGALIYFFVIKAGNRSSAMSSRPIAMRPAGQRGNRHPVRR
jgi:hypothetical protein